MKSGFVNILNKLIITNMLKNGGDNQIHQYKNLLRIKKAQLSLRFFGEERIRLISSLGDIQIPNINLLLRRLGSNQ